jgi:hypothetical protein
MRNQQALAHCTLVPSITVAAIEAGADFTGHRQGLLITGGHARAQASAQHFR